MMIAENNTTDRSHQRNFKGISNRSEYNTLVDGPIGNVMSTSNRFGQEIYDVRQTSGMRTISPSGEHTTSGIEGPDQETRHPIGQLKDINDVQLVYDHVGKVQKGKVNIRNMMKSQGGQTKRPDWKKLQNEVQRAILDEGRSEGTLATTNEPETNLSRVRSSAFNKSGVFTSHA